MSECRFFVNIESMHWPLDELKHVGPLIIILSSYFSEREHRCRLLYSMADRAKSVLDDSFFASSIANFKFCFVSTPLVKLFDPA